MRGGVIFLIEKSVGRKDICDNWNIRYSARRADAGGVTHIACCLLAPVGFMLVDSTHGAPVYRLIYRFLVSW